MTANPSLPYSTLNPDTSSDSPSAKSNGVRFVSARHEISQTPTRGINIIPLSQAVSYSRLSKSLNLPIKVKKNKKTKANLTSYEIVWATLRSPPIKAYLLLEIQPANRTG